jgi:hypothetical protein
MRTKLNITSGTSPLVSTPVMSAVETNTRDDPLLKKKERKKENKRMCYLNSIYNFGDLHNLKI